MQTRREGTVHVLDFGDGENRVDASFIAELSAAVDAVEASPRPRALVTTGSGRFYSNGLDLERIRALPPIEAARTLSTFDQLLGRLLAAPFVTVAAINGHCYAAGALVALAHDFRVMRVDRGYFCLPSVDVGIPFTTGMTRLVTAKIPPPLSQTLVVSGSRIGGAEAQRGGAVHEAVAASDVLPRAVALAEELSDKDPETLGTIKRRMYQPVLEHIETS